MAEIAYAPNGSVPSASSTSYNIFMNSISYGALAAVKQQITDEPELVNMFGWHRQTALHQACLLGSLEIVKVLLDAGADPNACNNFDETPLHYACKRGFPPVISYILEKGGNVQLVDKMGKGAVHHAAEAGSVPALHLLQSVFPDLNFNDQDSNMQSPMHLAIKAGKLETFKYLIRNGKCNLKCVDKDGNWPIHISAKEGYGHMTWTQLCILGLPAMHVVNKQGYTPFHLANMYDSLAHKELLSELEWQRRQPESGNVKQHAYLVWFFYLLLPVLSYGAAVVVTRFMPGYHALVFFPVVAYNANILKNSGHRIKHVSRWPSPAHAAAFAAGMFHTILVYLVVMMPYMGNYPALRLLSFVLIFLIVGAYVKLMTKDPGVMTSAAQDEKTGKTLTFHDVRGTNHWTIFCYECEMVQSKFTKHCKLCDTCMVGMDHHCLFLLRCIARGNHCLFVWFLILCVVCMALFVFGVFLYVSNAYAALAWWEVLQEMIAVDTWVMTIFLLNCCSVVWVSVMLLFQFSMISNGYTQYFKPRVPRGYSLNSFEKLQNLIYFLLNRRPLVVKTTVKITDADVV